MAPVSWTESTGMTVLDKEQQLSRLWLNQAYGLSPTRVTTYVNKGEVCHISDVSLQIVTCLARGGIVEGNTDAVAYSSSRPGQQQRRRGAP